MKGTAKAISVTICLMALFLLASSVSADTRPRLIDNPGLAQFRALQTEQAKHFTLLKSATTYQLQSDTLYEWGSNKWWQRERNIYTYHSGSLKSTWIHQVWDGSAWVDSLKYTYTYDESDRLLTWVEQKWVDPDWVNTQGATATYDDEAGTAVIYNQSWNTTDLVWESVIREVDVYIDGLLDTIRAALWVTDHWVDIERFTYTYDAGGLLTTQLQEDSSGGTWSNTARTSYLYNHDDLDSLRIVEAYDAGWDSLTLNQYAYDDMLNRVLNVYWEYDLDSTLFYEKTDDTLKFDAGLLVQSVHYEVDADSLSRVRHTNHPANSYRLEDLYQYLDGATWTNIKRQGFCWTPALVVDVDGDHGQVPTGYSISQNYPNPFNPETIIRYSLSQRAQVCISVYNVLGQEVATLVNETQSAGTYQTTWDGLDRSGKKAGSGIYFYRITAGDFTETRKMVLLK